MLLDYLFVYGSLMSEFVNNPFQSKITDHCEIIGNGVCDGKLFMLNGYPGFVENSHNEQFKVFGEILKFKNSDSILIELDGYEDYFFENPKESLYIRKKTTVTDFSSTLKFDCWIYVYNRSTKNADQILSGNFINFFKNQKK